MTTVNANKEFAVIMVAGKQYRVAVGDTVTVDRQFDDFESGKKVEIDQVLLLSNGDEVKIGTPIVGGASVQVIYDSEGLSKKIRVHRFRAKSRYNKTYGHRQPFTKLKVSAIKSS